MVNTTGNPGGGETGPAGPGAPYPVPGNRVPGSRDDGNPDQPGHDGYGGDYGYSGGYGYGPGYGDPDGGAGYSYGQPGYAEPGDAAGYGYGQQYAQGYGAPPAAPPSAAPPSAAPPSAAPPSAAPPPGAPAAAGRPAGPAGASFQPVPPVVAATPALKGYPGGPGLGDAAGGAAGREARRLTTPSVWQQSQRAWRESGVEWQRPVDDWELAEADWERAKAATSGKRRGGVGQAARSIGAAPGKLGGKRPGKPAARLPGGSLAGLSGLSPARSRSSALQVRRGVWQGAILVLIVLVLVVLGLVVFGGSGGKSAGPAAAPYPAARLAGADFGASSGQQARGIFQAVSGVAASGGTIVAVGSQTGQWIPRAQFLVSADGGHSWQLAPVHAPGGAAPSPADVPVFVTGGPGGWLALGNGAAWTSQDGRAWTLAPGPGISPLEAGDRVLGLARTAAGFVAVGENVPGGNLAKSGPVLWTSANGLSWRRLGGSGLHLAAPGGHVLLLSRVAARGSDVIITGEVLTTKTVTSKHGKTTTRHSTTSLAEGVWQSGNSGASWVPAHLPVGSGAANAIAGVAATRSGFVAVRPGSTKTTGADAVVYVSGTGASWARAAVITAPKKDNFRVIAVGGSDQGAVVAGRVASGAKVAFVSTDGRAWKSVASPGNQAESLSGVTVTAGATAVVAGATVRAADGQQPYLVLAGPRASPVSFAGIPGATGPALGISGIAVAGGTQVAVGSANGFPAIWSAGRSGHWIRVSSPVLARPGLGALASVVHGKPGWVAVGGIAAAPSRPVVVTSADGVSWQAADGEPTFGAPGVALSQAAAGRSGYVIVGRQVIPARVVTKTTVSHRHKQVTRQVVPSRTVAAAWWSAGPAGWVRGANATVGELNGPGVREMIGVTAGGPGFVAVGSVSHAPAVWTSSNGRRWQVTYLRTPAGASAAVLQRVAAQGNVLVAMGTETTRTGVTPFVEYSSDGGSLWQPVPLSAPGGFPAVTALTAAGKGFEAVGTVGQPGNQRVVVWSSRTGTSWKVREPAGTGLSSRGSQALTALTASGSALTGVGYVATPTGEQPTLWKAAAAGG